MSSAVQTRRPGDEGGGGAIKKRIILPGSDVRMVLDGYAEQQRKARAEDEARILAEAALIEANALKAKRAAEAFRVNNRQTTNALDQAIIEAAQASARSRSTVGKRHDPGIDNDNLSSARSLPDSLPSYRSEPKSNRSNRPRVDVGLDSHNIESAQSSARGPQMFHIGTPQRSARRLVDPSLDDNNIDSAPSTGRRPRADPTLDSNNLSTPASSRKSTARSALAATRPANVPPIDMKLVQQKLREQLLSRGGRSSGAGMARPGPIGRTVKANADSADFQPGYLPVRRAGRSGGTLKR